MSEEKSIRQIHIEDEAEAFQQAAFERFKATMDKLDREHKITQQQIKRDTRTIYWFIAIFALVTLASPFIAILIRHYVK